MVIGCMLAGASSASAATTHDLRGTFDCCGPGGASHQIFEITSMDLNSGSFSGVAKHPSGSAFSPITGTANGNSVSLTTGPYYGSSYSATFTGTIAAGSNSMSGTWTSNSSQSGTWTATRTSGGGGSQACTASATASAKTPTTQVATCASPAGPPSVCGPSGTILPQCYLPVTLPEICGPSNTILVACQSQGPYIVACGGFGTILPACNLPPPQLPQICGPSNTLLPPCTGANNPVLVCGPSNTILPQCNFGGPINATPLNLNDNSGTIAISVGCTTSQIGTRLARNVKQKPQGGKKCDVNLAIDAMRDAAGRSLKQEAAGLSQAFRYPVVLDCNSNPGLYNGFTPAQCDQVTKFNAQAFVTRASRITDRYFVLPRGSVSPRLTEAQRNGVKSELQKKTGSPTYADPTLLWQGVQGNQIVNPTLYYVPERFAESVQRQVEQVADVSNSVRANSNKRAAQQLYATASKKKKSSKPLVSKHFKLNQGKRKRLRIQLSRKVVRKLAKSVGKRSGKGRKYVAVRLTVSFRAKPMPIARFYDLRVPIKPKKK